MGSNDAKEMLEVAQEECIRLERIVREVIAERNQAELERAAALAVIEQAKFWNTTRHGPAHWDLHYILSQSPASALAKVKADAWDEGAEAPRDIYENVIAENPYRTKAS